MNIFSRLKSSKTSKELGESIDVIDADIASCQAEIKSIEESRERAIFEDGEAAVAKIQKDLSSRREQLELLQAARRGAVDRQAQAEAAERERQIQARYKEGLKLVARERELLKQWHLAATALADITSEVNVVQRAIENENGAMRAEGRSDLVLPNLAREVNAKRQEKWEKHYAGVQHPPVNVVASVGLNVPQLFHLPHYWPKPDIAPGKDWAGAPLAFLD